MIKRREFGRWRIRSESRGHENCCGWQRLVPRIQQVVELASLADTENAGRQGTQVCDHAILWSVLVVVQELMSDDQ